MPDLGKDDPEMAYRRGYQHGAAQAFHAMERLLDPETREILRAWIDADVYAWRYKALLADPPIWRLNMLNPVAQSGASAAIAPLRPRQTKRE